MTKLRAGSSSLPAVEAACRSLTQGSRPAPDIVGVAFGRSLKHHVPVNTSALVGTIGSTLELVAFTWAAATAARGLLRMRRRISMIRQMTKDADRAESSEWVAAERIRRGIPPEDSQLGDMLYPRTFIARDIAEDQVRALIGPGALAFVGLVVSLLGNALGI